MEYVWKEGCVESVWKQDDVCVRVSTGRRPPLSLGHFAG